MSPKSTTPQWLHPRPRRLARLRIPGSHPKTNIVTHQTMEDLPVTFVGNDEGTLQGTNISPKNCILKMIFLFPRWDMLIPWRVSIHSIIHDFVLPMFFFGRTQKKSGKIRRYGFSSTMPQTVRSIWAFGRQLRPLESTRCMAYMAWAAWRARGFPFPIIWIIWWLIRMNNQRIWTNNTNRQLRHHETSILQILKV